MAIKKVQAFSIVTLNQKRYEGFVKRNMWQKIIQQGSVNYFFFLKKNMTSLPKNITCRPKANKCLLNQYPKSTDRYKPTNSKFITDHDMTHRGGTKWVFDTRCGHR